MLILRGRGGRDVEWGPGEVSFLCSSMGCFCGRCLMNETKG